MPADLHKHLVSRIWFDLATRGFDIRGSAHLIGTLLQVGLASLGRGFGRSHGDPWETDARALCFRYELRRRAHGSCDGFSGAR